MGKSGKAAGIAGKKTLEIAADGMAANRGKEYQENRLNSIRIMAQAG